MILRMNGLEVECVIGERPDERTRTQTLRVDVEMEIPATAAVTDELSDTVDYAALAEAIRVALVAAKCRMIEHAAKVVYDLLPVEKAHVTVTKARAVPGLDSASVIYP